MIADQENVANMKRGYRFDDPNYSDSIPSTLSLKHGIRLWGITVHDGTAHAMGQMNERLGSNMRTLLYVGPGSGIAHRLVENGQPFTGGAEVSFIQNEMPNFMNLVERRADGKTVWAADWDLAARIAAGLAKSTELSFENQTAGVAKAQRFEETLRNIGLLQPADSFDILSAIERFPEEFREMDAIIAREIGSGIAYMMMESKKKFPDTYPDLKTLPVVLGGKITTPEQLAAVKRGAQEAFAEHPKFNVTDADVEAMFSLSVINDDVREFLAALGTDLFNARSEARFEFERENIVPTITPLIESRHPC